MEVKSYRWWWLRCHCWGWGWLPVAPACSSCCFSLFFVCLIIEGTDALGHLPKKEDEGDCSNDLGAKNSSDNECEDGKHVEHGVGGDGSRVVVVFKDSSVFMRKLCSLTCLAVWMRVYWVGDPMSLNTVLLLPLTGVSFYMLQECPVHSWDGIPVPKNFQMTPILSMTLGIAVSFVYGLRSDD